MGRINTTYSFRDRASPAISNVTQRMMVLSKRLNETRKSTLQVNVVMKDLVQSSIQTSVNITKLTSQVSRLTNSVKRLVTELDNSDSKLNKPFRGMIGSMGKASIALMGLESGFQLLGRTIAGIKSVGNFLNTFIKDASDYEAMLTNLSVAFGGVAESQDMFKRLQEFASQTPFTLPQAVKAATTFKSVGIETKKIIPTLALLGDLAKGNNEAFNHMALNYSQILSRGFANQRDLNEFSTWGVSVTKTLKDMGVDGVASAQAVTNALIKLTSEGQPFFQSMVSNAKTYSGILAQMKDSYQRLSADIGNGMLPSAKSFVRIFDRFFEGVRENPTIKDIGFGGVAKGSESFMNSMNAIVSTIPIITTALIGVGAVLLGMLMVANPISLIIMGIVIGLYQMIKAYSDWEKVNDFNFGTMEGVLSTIGNIIGAIKYLGKLIGTTFYNLSMTLINILLPISNFVIEFFSFNWLKDPIGALKSLGVGLYGMILSLLTPFTEFLDNIVQSVLEPIVKFLTFGKFDGNIAGVRSTNWVNDQLDWVNEVLKSENSKAFQFGKYKTFDKTFTEEKNSTALLFGEIGKEFDKAFGDIEKSIKNFNDLKEQPFKTDGQGNLMVNDVNSIKLADDFRDLLLEQARMRFQTYINTVTPNINVGDVHFEEKVDMNEFVDKLTDSAMRISQSELSVAYG